LSIELNRVQEMDVLDFLAELPANTADMIFADPPYNIKERGGRFSENVQGWKEYWAWCEAWINNAAAILKDTGSMFLKCPARTSGYFQVILDKYLEYRNQIILLTPVHPTRRSFLNEHEVLLFYAKNKKRAFYNPTAELWPRNGNKNWWYKDKYRELEGDRISDIWTDVKCIVAGSLVSQETILKPNTRSKAHPNQMPVKIAERCILFTTKPYNLVVDLFAGSGTVPTAAARLNRYFMACDINPEYAALANVRAGQNALEFSQDCLNKMEGIEEFEQCRE